jgi:16S rRNA (guanine966-N2)-methyltransferase
MSEKMRGAIFNLLGDIDGLTVFDAFAGSGAVAFEAVSRGAQHALCIDVTRQAHSTITNNAKRLGVERQVKAVRANVSSWSDNNPTMQFDLVMCDPPYDDISLQLLQKLVRHTRPGGIYVLSLPGAMQAPAFVGLTLLTCKGYGDGQLVYYKRV